MSEMEVHAIDFPCNWLKIVDIVAEERMIDRMVLTSAGATCKVPDVGELCHGIRRIRWLCLH